MAKRNYAYYTGHALAIVEVSELLMSYMYVYGDETTHAHS